VRHDPAARSMGGIVRPAWILPLAGLFATVIPAGPSAAQEFWGGYTPIGPGVGLPDRPGGFTFCRLAYTSVRRTPSGNGWRVDFPRGDRHLTMRLAELTPTPTSSWSFGEPGFAVVLPTDPDLFRCPFLFASDVGQLGFSEADAEAMREFLLKGGFLWVDDFWGSASWRYFEAEMARVLPEFDIVELPQDHPLFDIVYHIPEVPQIPNLGFWRRTGGETSELGFDSARATMSAIMDHSGKILVLITHNTDIADAWEREPDDDLYFALFSPDAYAIGVNVAVWMMTH
jgi:hypothetical protein